MKYIKGILGAGILILLDQLTKIWAQSVLQNKTPIEIIPNVFELHYLENRGAAFGILQDQTIFFVLLTSLVLCIIAFVFFKLPGSAKYRPLQVTLVFLFGGAAGNLIDRVRLDYVIDFLYFKLIDFPIFNVADCYVTLSAVVLVILFLFYYKEEDLNFFTGSKKNGREH